ncbi:MAG: hypothetical protein ACK5AO_08265 [bacterium]|jgi:hypothetical protein
MKKRLLITCFIASFFLGATFAQEKDTVVALPEIRVTSPTVVTEKVARSFIKSFPGAENLRWYKYDQDYLAKFIQKDMDHSAFFRKNGFLIYDVSYGIEKHLPAEIKSLLENAYDNYEIYRVINVKSEGRDVWIVKLEGMKKFATVRIENGEIDEFERYDKTVASK